MRQLLFCVFRLTCAVVENVDLRYATLRKLVYLFRPAAESRCRQPGVISGAPAALERVPQARATCAVEALLESTPTMLQAALARDPAAMGGALAALEPCHPAKTCAGYSSCTAWSTFAKGDWGCTFTLISLLVPSSRTWLPEQVTSRLAWHGAALRVVATASLPGRGEVAVVANKSRGHGTDLRERLEV
jgi:hypothetical protein